MCQNNENTQAPDSTIKYLLVSIGILLFVLVMLFVLRQVAHSSYGGYSVLDVIDEDYEDLKGTITKATGTVEDVDEDSFFVYIGNSCGEVHFEHIWIYVPEKEKTMRFIFLCPSNVRKEDKVEFEYIEKKRVTCKDILAGYTNYNCQEAVFYVDGLIINKSLKPLEE